eukprot:1421173-Prymnesium_polylepis.1
MASMMPSSPTSFCLYPAANASQRPRPSTIVPLLMRAKPRSKRGTRWLSTNASTLELSVASRSCGVAANVYGHRRIADWSTTLNGPAFSGSSIWRCCIRSRPSHPRQRTTVQRAARRHDEPAPTSMSNGLRLELRGVRGGRGPALGGGGCRNF